MKGFRLAAFGLACLLAAALFVPEAEATGCPPFTSETRTIPLDEQRKFVLPAPACVDKESREKNRPLPLPPQCPEGEAPVYRHGRWGCVPPR